jgi:uncharacterized protein
MAAEGAVIVPVLFEVFRLLGVPDSVRMQLCIGTSSLAIIVPTTLRSYHTHEMRGVGALRRDATLGAAMAGVAVGSVSRRSRPPTSSRRPLS